MTVPTNTVQTYSRVGNREDLTDMIYDISPTDTPMMSNIRRETASNTYVEWQTDNLAAADADNKTVEGDDVTADAAPATVRVGSHTQLMDKAVTVSSTQQATDHAGMKKMLSYQVSRRARELKRDMEKRIAGNYASDAGNATTPRETAGAAAWLTSNVEFGVGGSAGGFSGGTVAAATAGTARAFTEDQLKEVIKGCWDSGGEPNLIMVGSRNKQVASTFGGIATLYRDTQGSSQQASILAGADLYISDFGQLQIVPNRFSAADIALVLDPEYWGIAYLQNFRTEKLAKTGHSEKRLLSVEFALCAKNEASSGAVFDLTTT